MNRRHLLLTALGALVAAALPPFHLSRPNKVPIAELFVSVSQDVSSATRFEKIRPNAIAFSTAGAAIGSGITFVGPVIIGTEADADAFLQRMAQIIAQSERSPA